MKFYLGEHIPLAVAKELRKRGFSVMTVEEAGRRSMPDSDHLQFAHEQSMIIVTADDDFLALESRESVSHAGIIFLTSPAGSVGAILSQICRIAEMLTEKEMVNHVEFIS